MAFCKSLGISRRIIIDYTIYIAGVVKQEREREGGGGGGYRGTEFVTRLFINMYDIKPNAEALLTTHACVLVYINLDDGVRRHIGSRGRKSRRPQIGLSDFRATCPDKNGPLEPCLEGPRGGLSTTAGSLGR